MKVGNRIIYDQDGEIIFQTGEMQGDVLERKVITELNFIDLPYGTIEYRTHRIVRINTETNEPVLEETPITLTLEQ